MLNVCPGCGMYQVEKQVTVQPDSGLGVAICGTCGARLTFIHRPLFVVTGASGTGKSATCLELMRRQTGLLTLESDILWGAIDVSGEAGIDCYWNAWLRMIKNISQGPQSVVLCGMLVPETLERQPERHYIGDTQFLALVADPREQECRVSGFIGRPDEIVTQLGPPRRLERPRPMHGAIPEHRQGELALGIRPHQRPGLTPVTERPG